MTTQEKVNRIISINKEIKELNYRISFFSEISEDAALYVRNTIGGYQSSTGLPHSVLISVAAKETIRLKGELGKLNMELNKLLK